MQYNVLMVDHTSTSTYIQHTKHTYLWLQPYPLSDNRRVITHTRTHTYSVFEYSCRCSHTHIPTQLFTHTHTHTHTRASTHTGVHIHTYSQRCSHTYTCSHTSTDPKADLLDTTIHKYFVHADPAVTHIRYPTHIGVVQVL